MDPLRAALRITEQIPASEKYPAEFRFCWRAVGRAALRVGDDEAFNRAIAALGNEREGAELRLCALRTSHARAAEFRRAFAEQPTEWEPTLWPAEQSELLLLLLQEADFPTALQFADGMADASTRVYLLVELAKAVADPDARLAALKLAREAVDDTTDEDHDPLLMDVAEAYLDVRQFELVQEAIANLREPKHQRILGNSLKEAVAGTRQKTTRPPTVHPAPEWPGDPAWRHDWDSMASASGTAGEVAALIREKQWEAATALMREHYPERVHPATVSLPEEVLADLLLCQLERVVERNRNDLKVEWLTDLEVALREGHIGLPSAVSTALEERSFLQPLAPATPSISSLDLSVLGFDEFVSHLLDRPYARTDEEKRIFDPTTETDPEVSDTESLVRLTARLFREFGDIGPRYSVEQVDQAIWYLQSYPCFVFDLRADQVTEAAAQDLIASTYHLFADYVARQEIDKYDSVFFMLYDQFWENEGILPTLFETMVRVLGINHETCRVAALHGLNHLVGRNDGWEQPVQTAIDEFVAREGDHLDADLLEYARLCREGRTM